ncbi:MAG TPA: hypothetical protein VFE45_19025 [Coriobacteriia bacterium]|nr:hypothetical protein [Coriobacteriia bacterium]
MLKNRVPALLASAAMVCASTAGLSATTAAASPMAHFSFPATEEGTYECDTRAYTFTGGDFLVVTRDSSVAAHIIANHVTAVDGEGTPYAVVGTETYNDTFGHLTADLSFVGQTTGRTDSVTLVLRYYRDATTVHFGLDFGTCHYW